MRTRIELSEEEVKVLILSAFAAPLDCTKLLRVDSLMMIPGYGLEAEITDAPLLPIIPVSKNHREMQETLDAGEGVTVTTSTDDDSMMF